MSIPPVIAIVDDDEAVREALCDLLLVEGFTARPFASAVTFLAGRAAEEVDCLITDVRMPDIDGIELQRRLRAGGSAMPVIVITASVNEALWRQAFAGGACACLPKPVGDRALLEALHAALGGRRHAED